MMEQQKPLQPALFYSFNLEQRVPTDHPLRAVAATIDFDFVYQEVEDLYGGTGRPSIPPPVILKLMFLLAFENVPSERRLLATLPVRLDWLWFLGFDLDSAVPDHSVLSKARSRWGVTAFRSFFKRVIQQAEDCGLIDGTKIFCDGSLFDANASRKSITPVGIVDLDAISAEFERRLDSIEDDAGLPPVHGERRSTTDPDAAVVTKPTAGPGRPRYKAHRAVDDRVGIITATQVTPGNIDEGHELEDLINQHEHNTGVEVDLVVADTQYGTAENYLMCIDRAIIPRMRQLSAQNEKRQKSRGQFSRNEFTYDEATDTYRCPNGATLERTQAREDRNAVRYSTRDAQCAQCDLKQSCTTGKSRSITRHVRQSEIDLVLAENKTERARDDLRRRKHFMERSFAVAVRHGFKRCRWRGLWRAEIHELLIATVQNITTLIRRGVPKRHPSAAATVKAIFKAGALRLVARTITALVPPTRLAAWSESG
ncbi:MAG: transposase [Thermoanaerobaculia bacterium]